MEFLPADLIRKKRSGAAHTPRELNCLIQAYARGDIPDYQMSAWLMAVCFNGMTPNETACLTHEMRDSGRVLDLSALGITVDKHSTGGIGDKTSLILAPLVAAAGVPVPMMAGRGLGHTGGTLDKLESIPGFNVSLDLDAFVAQIAKIGGAIIGQTPEICPADRKLYALRDVTGTVDSLPLICGSIMSKKLAEGMSALVLDVKFGSGAFMKTVDDAELLARALKGIGEHSGKHVTALLTGMQQPLGRFIGNALEVRECLDIMSGRPAPGPGKGYDDTEALTLELAAHMIHLGRQAPTPAAGRLRAKELLKNGAALAKFGEICRAQGGSLDGALPKAQHVDDVNAKHAGFVNFTNLECFGQASVHLGAGRRFQSDQLDFAAGLEILVEQGQRVEVGETLFKVHHSRPEALTAALQTLNGGFELSARAVETEPLIARTLN